MALLRVRPKVVAAGLYNKSLEVELGEETDSTPLVNLPANTRIPIEKVLRRKTG